MNATGGEFLGFLQSAHAGRLKEGRAPAFATSRWAAGLYSAGLTVRCVRLALGRVAIVMEVLYSLCFFTHLQNLLVSREARLASALSDLLGQLYDLHSDFSLQIAALMSDFQVANILWLCSAGLLGLPVLIGSSMWKVAAHAHNWVVLLMLLQHIATVFFTIDSLWRALRGAVKSAMTFHKAAKKVNKAVKKARANE
uniref:Uncharacterized protein n=1 Tax=Zooxanthella nutricula TaxID=1333877 RepID=A0A7S2JFL6_9DINO